MIKRCNLGLTLIEIIISMAIFGTLSLILISMFSTAYIWLTNAGDKGEASYKSQKDVETRTATGDTVYTNDLIIKVDGVNYKIRGGLIETYETSGTMSSKIESFVPLVPTFKVDPLIRFEGDTSTNVSLTGFETHFNSTTIIELYNKAGTTKIATILPSSVSSDSLSFNLPTNLINDDYVIRTVTNLTGKPDEIARAKYTVEQPNFLAVGNKSVYISADGESWINRSLVIPFPTFSDLNSVTNNGNIYVIVGASGRVLFSKEKLPWTAKNVGSEDINGIGWSTYYNKFYAVGAEGGIYTSENGETWSTFSSGINVELNDITTMPVSLANDIVTIVGNDGTIFTADDGRSFSKVNMGTYIDDLAAVTSGYSNLNPIMVAVGSNGIVTSTVDGSVWTTPSSICVSDFNDICFNKALNMFIAVGNNGLIMLSNDGLNWTDISYGTENFLGVFSTSNKIIVVGDNRNILFSDDLGVSWTQTTPVLNDHLLSVAGK